MKVFAIASLKPNITIDQVRKRLPDEVPATLKLYLESKIEQFWFREAFGPIFLLNVESVEQAKAILGALPLVAEDLMACELLPGHDAQPAWLADPGQVNAD
jgi:hypothetical protein